MRFYKTIGFLFVLLLTSCDFLLIKPDTIYSSEENFETLWNDINNTYVYFKYDNTNWDSLYQVYRPQVIKTTTNDELFSDFQGLLRPLLDGQIKLINTNGVIWENERHFVYLHNYNSSTIATYYLNNKAGYIVSQNTITNKADTVLIYGTINNSILYFNITTFQTNYNFNRALDSLLATTSYKGIILDVRDNNGGSLTLMRTFAGMFTNSEVVYGYTQDKIGPLQTDFSSPASISFNHSSGDSVFTKPVVVLTDRYTWGAAEQLRLALKQLSNVTTAGDTTAGATSGTIQRSLPNGMQYVLSGAITYDINMNIYEKKGIPPDVAVTTPSNLSTTRDFILEKAITLIP